MNSFRRKKAQQVVEFLLIAPFIIGFLALFTEYGYALNINLTLTKVLKASTAKIYQYIRPDMTNDDLVTLVKNNLINDLNSNYIPTKNENNINVTLVKNDSIGVFIARYTYIPAFSLPAIFFKIMPDKFEFMASSAVPLGLLRPNKFNAPKSSNELDEIWGAKDFASLDSFKSEKKGILASDTNNKRKTILFLVPSKYFSQKLPNSYALINWQGEYLKTDGAYLIYNKSAKLQKCTSTGSELTCEDSSFTPFDYLINNNFYYIYVVQDSETEKITESLDAIQNYWNPTKSDDLSESPINSLLKRIISLVNQDRKTIGNYDNIDTGSRSDISAECIVRIYPFGSMIFVDKSAEIRDNITRDKNKPSFNDF